MNENVIFLMTISSVLLGFLAERSHRHQAAWFCNVAAAVGYGSWSLVAFWRRDFIWACVSGGYCGWHIYLAWRNRPRKHRLADKVIGVVRDLGHRLKVVPEAAAQGGRS